FMGLCSFSVNGQESFQRYELVVPTMGTKLELVVYATSRTHAKSAIDAGLAEIERLSPILSNYEAQSEISVLCDKAYGAPVAVSNDLGSVLWHAHRWYRLSQGSFDITVGPLTRLWRTARKQKMLPNSSDVAIAKEQCGWNRLKLNAGSEPTEVRDAITSVQLLVPNMRLDVSGIATGYIIDRAFEKIVASGIDSLLINIGGDIRVGKAPPGKPGWKIDVAGLGAGTEPLMTLSIANQAVTSSGDVHQFVEIAGRRYSHFIDPATGSPIERRQCVTAFAATTIDADAGATALAVLGLDRSSEIFESTPLSRAILVESNDVHQTGPRLRDLVRD
ncbi:MAG: FAD:protein FMN transferase, partial [Pirellula sp.]